MGFYLPRLDIVPIPIWNHPTEQSITIQLAPCSTAKTTRGSKQLVLYCTENASPSSSINGFDRCFVTKNVTNYN